MSWTDLLAYGPAAADYGITLVMGVGIAATCGLRAFLPLLAVNLLALSGRVELNESFAFLGAWPATLLFGTATVAELAGDKIPGFDHFMDAYGLVVKPTAATISAAAFVSHVDPLTAVALGMIGGGTSATVLGVAKAKVRLASSALTAGLGNGMLSLGEDAIALGGIGLSVLAPMLGVGVALFVASCAFVWVANRRANRAALRAMPAAA